MMLAKHGNAALGVEGGEAMTGNHRNGSERPERDKAPPAPNPPDDQPNPSGQPLPPSGSESTQSEP